MRGFRINGTGDADSLAYTRNLIEYSPGSLASAETVARDISGAPKFEENSTIQVNEIWLLGVTCDGVTD